MKVSQCPWGEVNVEATDKKRQGMKCAILHFRCGMPAGALHIAVTPGKAILIIFFLE